MKRISHKKRDKISKACKRCEVNAFRICNISDEVSEIAKVAVITSEEDVKLSTVDVCGVKSSLSSSLTNCGVFEIESSHSNSSMVVNNKVLKYRKQS